MTATVLLLSALLTQVPNVPSLDTALGLLKRFREEGGVAAVGPVPLNGFNFSKVVHVGRGAAALVISTLWESGIFLYDAAGNASDFMPCAEVTRLWAVDLDQDGTIELLTDERVGRGTGFQLYEFRLYTLTGGRLKRIWKAESYRLEANVSVQVDRRSYVRIRSTPTPHLEYLRPCGRQQCLQQLVVEAGQVRDASSR
jgi:hypothetical protein